MYRNVLRNLVKARDDSSKHQALKELLKSRGADHILATKPGTDRYDDRRTIHKLAKGGDTSSITH